MLYDAALAAWAPTTVERYSKSLAEWQRFAESHVKVALGLPAGGACVVNLRTGCGSRGAWRHPASR